MTTMTHVVAIGGIRRRISWDLARKLARYAGVSAISTATSLSVLAVLVATDSVTPGWANVIATAVGTIPSFELNRRWVWGRHDRRSLLAEIGPFCGLSLLELGVSTLAVSAATGWAADHHFSDLARTAVATGSSVVAFGSLWVAQFVILDRLLFGSSRRR